MKSLVALALSACFAAGAFAQDNAQDPRAALENNGSFARPVGSSVERIIVKWRGGARSVMGKPSAERAGKLSATSGLSLKHNRNGSGGTEVYQLASGMALSELQPLLDKLNADPDVAYAVADQRRWRHAVPNDPRYAEQWYLASTEVAATRSEQAWDITTGDRAVVVAVLDTGVRPEHPDLTGKLLTGYDFVSDPVFANDDPANFEGNSRDADATDPGDWIEDSDRSRPQFSGCVVSRSSWHGTRVASVIGATTNEAFGMAGVGWETRIVPVRVLGKCSGTDADIIDGLRWAAGLDVPDAPVNDNPARVINLSLGGDGACTSAYQDAIDEVTAMGVLVVASVGNDSTVVSAPANCNNVVGVSALRHAGTKVGYSNLGPMADIGAPGGNCGTGSTCVFSILSATNNGQTGPTTSGYTDQNSAINVGSSFSSPLVAGAAALIYSMNSRLSPDNVLTLLQESATPFPTQAASAVGICRPPANANQVQQTECVCTARTCGAGMLNTAAAVIAALKPFGVVNAPATIEPNTLVAIDSDGSFGLEGRSLVSYQWSVSNVSGATPTLADANAAATTLQVTGNSRFTLTLRVTDDQGTIDDTDFAMVTTVSPDPAPTPIPSTPLGSSGGGGNFDWWLLVLGLLPLAFAGPRRRRARVVRSGRACRNDRSREASHNVNSASRSYRSRRRQHFGE